MLMIIARNYRTVYKSTATTRGLRTSTETIAALVQNNKTDCIAEGRTLENHNYYIPQKDIVSSVTNCGCSDERYLHNGHGHSRTHTLQVARKSKNRVRYLRKSTREFGLRSLFRSRSIY